MSVRLTEKLGLAAGAVGGLALSPGVINGDVSKIVPIFLGLISASILPTITLLINGMTSGGRSVKALDDLKVEYDAAMDALFLLLGCVGIVIAALVSLAIPSPHFLERVPYLSSEILPRLGQAMVVWPSVIALMRVGHIPAILRRALKVRHDLAVEEARRKTLEQAAKVGEAAKYFPTNPEFGKAVNISDLRRRD